MSKPHPNWKGDAVKRKTGHWRARQRYPLGPCELCHEKGIERHHKDGNTLNNEPENIQILCRRCHMKVDGRIGRQGVCWDKRKGRWRARPWRDGRKHSLGYFDTEQAARRAVELFHEEFAA